MNKKATMLMCILVMVCYLAACGSKDGTSSESDSTEKKNDTSSESDSTGKKNDTSSEKPTVEPEAEKIKGSTGSWGIYSEIFVPEGMHIKTGNITDADDENAVWVNKDDNPLNYFYFILSTAEQSQKDIDATKTANAKYNPEEVTVKAGDYEWKGLAYSYLGTDVAQMYATIGDKVINVRMTGFAYNADITIAVLGSAKLKDVKTIDETTGTPKEKSDSIVKFATEQPGSLADALEMKYSDFPQGIYDMIAEDWKKYDKMDEMQRVYSSHVFGCCSMQFETWDKAVEFIGVTPWNPLENADWAVKMKDSRKTGRDGMMLDYRTEFCGHRDGRLENLELMCDYHIDSGFVNVIISLYNATGKCVAWPEDEPGDVTGLEFCVAQAGGKQTVRADIKVVHTDNYDAVRIALPEASNFKYMFNITSYKGVEELFKMFDDVCENVGIPMNYDQLLQKIANNTPQ